MLHEEARQEQAKNRNTPEYFAALRLRKIWCEGNFSHQKAEHNLRRTYKRGIERVTEQCLLSACAMNLIRLVKAANAVFIHCLGAIFQGLFRLGYLSTAPKRDTLLHFYWLGFEAQRQATRSRFRVSMEGIVDLPDKFFCLCNLIHL